MKKLSLILMLLLLSSFAFATDFTTNNAFWVSANSGAIIDDNEAITLLNSGVSISGSNMVFVSSQSDYLGLGNSILDSSNIGTQITRLTINSLATDSELFAVGSTPSGDPVGVIRIDTNGKLIWIYRSDAGSGINVCTGETTLTTSTIYNLAVSSSGSSYDFNINGIDEDFTCSGGNNGNWIADIGTSFTLRYTIGASSANVRSSFLDATMQYSAYYSTQLSTAVLLELYNLGDNYNPYIAPTSDPLFTLTASGNKSLTPINTFTATLSNSTWSEETTTTNGTIYYDLSHIKKNYDLEIFGISYALFNTTLENINNSDTYTAYLYENNSISINIFDGKTKALITNKNISYIIDGTNTSYYSEGTTSNGTLYLSFLDADKYKFSFFKTDIYPTQEYFVTLQDNEYKELSAFLINNTYVATTIISLFDPYNEVVEDATISMQENIGGSYTTVSQKITDSTGQAKFYLQIDKTYQAIIEKTGYSTRTATITPTSSDYAVTLRIDPTITFNYTVPYQGVSFSYNPTDLILNASLQNFSLFVSSSDGLLNYFGVYYNSTTKTNITTSPSGGTASLPIDFTGFNGNANITYFFKSSGQDLYSIQVKYYFENITEYNSSLVYGLNDIKDDFNILARILIIIGSILFLSLISYELGLPSKVYGFGATLVLIIVALPSVAWVPAVIPIVVGLLSFMNIFFEGNNYA